MKNNIKKTLLIFIIFIATSMPSFVLADNKAPQTQAQTKTNDVYKQLPLKEKDDFRFMLNKLMIAFLGVGVSGLVLYLLILAYKKNFNKQVGSPGETLNYQDSLFAPEDEDEAIREFLHRFK